MQIHLAKPGGQKEGPFSLEQVQQNVADGVFRDADYWAWHEGLTEWIPLYRLLRSLASPPAAAPASATPDSDSAAATADREAASFQLARTRVSAPNAAGATVLAHGEPSVAHQAASAQLSDAGLSHASAVTISDPGDQTFAAIFSRASSVVADPDLAAVISNPDSSHSDPKPSFVAESDVVTALVQAVAEPEAATLASGRAAGFQSVSQNGAARKPDAVPVADQPAASAVDQASRLTPEPALPGERGAPSGMPCSALERIVIFSTGERQSLWSSATAVQTMRDTIGEDPDFIRQTIPRDLIFNCDAASLLGFDGVLSDSVWKAIAARHPELVEKQRQGASQVCVRSFRLEFGAIVVLVLFYDNARLGLRPDPRN